MSKPVLDFLDFVKRSPSAFHACSSAVQALKEAGFVRLGERDAWHLSAGGRYFLTRNHSSVVAFAVPEDGFTHFQLVVSHSDSPMFKLKPNAEDVVLGRYLRLDVERYGSMIMSTWLDRPLSVAGRVLVRDGNKIASRLVNVDRDMLVIPNMPIHFNREVNDGYRYNVQVDLQPLYGSADAKGALDREIAQSCGARSEDIVGRDLFIYNRMPGTVWGADDAFFSSPRIDDLECAFTSLRAFLQTPPKGHINVFAMLDNEEIGSTSKQGANSTILADTLKRAAVSLGMDDGQTRGAILASFLLSADNAHAIHPNHPEKYDPLNCTAMNGGVVIKHNAHQKYVTDGVSTALFGEICRQAGVPVQHFVNRSDLPGGSTLGSIASARISMNAADVGLAQLAMHSCYETAGVQDVTHMLCALSAFYAADIRAYADGDYALS